MGSHHIGEVNQKKNRAQRIKDYNQTPKVKVILIGGFCHFLIIFYVFSMSVPKTAVTEVYLFFITFFHFPPMKANKIDILSINISLII